MEGGVDVPIADGGTGQSTAQAAIDALTQVSGASEGDVLTKDGDGHASFQAPAGGSIPRIFEIKPFDDLSTVSTGDGKAIFCIPVELNGYLLTDCEAYVSTVSGSGALTIQLRNVTDTQDMLSTRITIDANEYTSYTAATAPVIDTDHDDVATGDRIAIDVDGAGVGAKGLGVIMTFTAP